MPPPTTQTVTVKYRLSTYHKNEREKIKENHTIKQILYNKKHDTDIVRKIHRTNNEQEHKEGKINEYGQNSHMLEHKQI